MDFEGGCQCGRVRFRAVGPHAPASVCFCRMCQKAGAAPFMTFVRFAAASVTWSERPAVFASSNTVERGFCAQCGTPLSYQRTGGPNISLTLYSFDAPATIEPAVAFAVEQKAAWLDRMDTLPDQALSVTADFIGHQHPDRQ